MHGGIIRRCIRRDRRVEFLRDRKKAFMISFCSAGRLAPSLPSPAFAVAARWHYLDASMMMSNSGNGAA
jgi:hypothetical protein